MTMEYVAAVVRDWIVVPSRAEGAVNIGIAVTCFVAYGQQIPLGKDEIVAAAFANGCEDRCATAGNLPVTRHEALPF